MQKNRQSIRLKNYDYSKLGLYFVTICTENRKNVFGEIVGARRDSPETIERDRPVSMILNQYGKIVENVWESLPDHHMVELDAFQIMPNHIHTIIHIVGADPCVRPNILINGSTRGSTPTAGTMIQWFKTMSTNEYIKNVNEKKWKPFNKRLWQRNYYEHIIRTENDLNKIREYISDNPSTLPVKFNCLPRIHATMRRGRRPREWKVLYGG